jgi:hypothetical protein
VYVLDDDEPVAELQRGDIDVLLLETKKNAANVEGLRWRGGTACALLAP